MTTKTVDRVVLVLAPCWTNFCPPLGIALLAAVLRQNKYAVKCFDYSIDAFRKAPNATLAQYWDFSEHHRWNTPESFQNNILPHFKALFEAYAQELCNYSPDVLGFSIFNTSLEASVYIATIVKEKKPEVKIIFGGPGCADVSSGNSPLTSKYKHIPDAIVIGEGEETFLELLRQYAAEKPSFDIPNVYIKKDNTFACKNPHQGNPIDLNTLPCPDFSDFPLHLYLFPHLPLLTSRGCIAKCAFCSETIYFEKYRYRTAEHILNEIKNNLTKYHTNVFYFNDSLINGNIQELERFVDLALAENIGFSWGGYARVHPGLTRKLLRKMKQAGCQMLSFGIESGSQKVVNDMRKGFLLKTATQNLKNTAAVGIRPEVNWIIGFPTENFFDFLQSLYFVFKNRKYISRINPGQEPCGIPSKSYLDLNRTKFKIAPALYNGSWATLNHRNTITIRKTRLVIFRHWLNLLRIPHS